MSNIFDYNEDELTPYRKKRGKKRSVKSNHKHLYEKCLIDENGHLCVGKFCTVCGKTEITNYFVTVPSEIGCYRMIIEDEEVRSLYPDLPIKKSSRGVINE